MKFCTPEQYRGFLHNAPIFEKALTDNGIQLIKYWFEVGMEEQERRFRARIEDPRKIWKLSPMDVESYKRWYEYSPARDDVLLSRPALGVVAEGRHTPLLPDAPSKGLFVLNVRRHWPPWNARSICP